MSTPIQPRFVHASHYASLLLQVSEHLYAGQTFFSLAQEHRINVHNQTHQLLMMARWQVESLGFATIFAAQPTGPFAFAPAEQSLGASVPPAATTDAPKGVSEIGHYL